jgi:hypothetical protein
MRLVHAFCATVTCTVVVAATTVGFGQTTDIATRTKGSQRVVVATVANVQSVMSSNAHGDQVIMSRLLLQVEETLKGQAQPTVSVDIEGGTVGPLTLRVSDMPSLNQGDRGVFFTNPGPSGADMPHLRGLGILKLDASNRVEDSNLTLEEVKRSVQAAR